MGQSANYAAVKDAQIKPSKEECVLDMGQRRRRRYAAAKDALINLKKEECVLSMGQRANNDAAEKDV